MAMALRLAYGWSQVSQAPNNFYVQQFAQETGSIAHSLAVGKGYSSPYGAESGPTAWLTPIYPLLIAGIFRIFGVETLPSFLASVLMNMIFSAATCIPIFYAAKRIASSTSESASGREGVGPAAGAAWAWALFPNAIILPFQWIWDTSLTALLVAVLLWATLCLADSQRWRDWCAYGLLWGVMLMVNPAPGVLLPFWLAWLAYRSSTSSRAARPSPARGPAQTFDRPAHARPAREWLLRPALAAAIAFLCCVPWTVRNYLVFHEFVPLRSDLGLELYVGNNENYDDVHPRVFPYLITKDRELYRFSQMGEMPFVHEEMRKALNFIVGHPRVEVRLTAERAISFWMGTPTPLRDFHRADTFLLQMVSVCNLLAVLGTLGGIAVLYYRRNEFTFPLAISPIVFPLLYYATHASLRYRHPLDPVIVILATIAAAAPPQALANRRQTARARAG
jgi:hypothetical protein